MVDWDPECSSKFVNYGLSTTDRRFTQGLGLGTIYFTVKTDWKVMALSVLDQWMCIVTVKWLFILQGTHTLKFIDICPRKSALHIFPLNNFLYLPIHLVKLSMWQAGNNGYPCFR